MLDEDILKLPLINDKMKFSGIYIIFNSENRKKYIGSSINIYKRYRQHCNELINNRHGNQYLQNSYNKNPNNFQFLLLEKTLNDRNILIEREQYWFDLTQSYKDNFGYNINPTAGNMTGFKFSEEQCKQRSIDRMGSKNSYYGKTHSDEIKNKMKINRHNKHPGFKLTKEDVLKIYELLEQGLSNTEIAKMYNVKQHTISQIKTGTRWTFLYEQYFEKDIV